MRLTPTAILLCACTLGIAARAGADTITINDFGRGRYSTTGTTGNSPNNPYGAGYFNGNGSTWEEWRNWFAFSLGNITGTVTSATLSLGGATYTSPDATE